MQENAMQKQKTVLRGTRAGRALPASAILAMVLYAGFGVGAAQAESGDAAAGKAMAGLCAACHGPDGISVNPLWPSLAGQQQAYLAAQIRAFRDRERDEITMQPFVENLSDADIDNLAAYYAGLSPCP